MSETVRPPRPRCAADIMTAGVVTIRADQSVSALGRLLRERRITGVVVVDDVGAPVGVASIRDLCTALSTERDRARERREIEAAGFYFAADDAAGLVEMPEQDAGDAPVSSIMTPWIVDVTADAPLTEVACVMDRLRVHRVLVTSEGRLQGIISASDFVRLAARGMLLP